MTRPVRLNAVLKQPNDDLSGESKGDNPDTDNHQSQPEQSQIEPIHNLPPELRELIGPYKYGNRTLELTARHVAFAYYRVVEKLPYSTSLRKAGYGNNLAKQGKRALFVIHGLAEAQRKVEALYRPPEPGEGKKRIEATLGSIMETSDDERNRIAAASQLGKAYGMFQPEVAIGIFNSPVPRGGDELLALVEDKE